MKNSSILVSVRIPQPVEKVFRAWSKPELLKKWFAEDSEKRPGSLEMDHRVGGRFRATLHILNETYAITGEYKEIIANEKIAYTQGFEDNLQYSIYVTVEFRKKEFGTEILVTLEDLQSEDEAEGHRSSWEASLARLAKKFADGEL